ncbi:MAG TPA: hypothetical protein VIO80_15095 [Candidatus Dormibacteraeota bacterium]
MPSFVTSTPFLAVTGVIILILLIAFVASRLQGGQRKRGPHRRRLSWRQGAR